MKKSTKSCVLAFFILGGFLITSPLNAQDSITLQNGLRVIIKEDHKSPIVVFSAFIDVGSAQEDEYLGSGMCHLIEHMLFKGTDKYPKGRIEDILHMYGGNIDGFTSYDYTGYRITILKEHALVAMGILKEMLSAPTFDPKELKKEMQVIEREIDLCRDDPGKRLSRLTFSRAYLKHPYRVPIIGYKENFRRLKQQDLVKFFKSNYTPENIIIAVVGDVEEDRISAQMQELFKDMPRGNNKIPVLPSEPEQLGKRLIEEKADIDGAYLSMAFHSTPLLNKDLYALDLLSYILGQGETSILNKGLRLEKELVLSVSAYNYTPKDAGLFVISSVLKEENVKTAIDEILKEINAVKQDGVSIDQLNRAKNNFLAGYVYEKETMESQANDLATGELLTGDPGFFEQYIAAVKNVTLPAIKQAASEYLNEDNMTVTVLSRSGAASGSAPDNVSQKHERDIRKVRLNNDLTVLIAEDPNLPILSINLLIKGGLRLETDKNNGISLLLSRMLMNGTDTMTRQELADSYESKGISLGTYSANNSLGISAKCLSEHTETVFKLISDICKNPVFPEEELRREKNELASEIDMQDNKVFQHGHRLLKELLFKAHPYRLQATGTKQSTANIQRQDLIEFYNGLFSPGNMVLGIAGDCNADEIENLAGKYFSDISLARPPSPAPKKEPAIREKRQQDVRTQKEQSLILIGFQGIDIYSENRYAFEVMTDILSRGSGILFKNIRDNEGLAYATGAFEVLGIDPGYIALYCLTPKENIDIVRSMIFKEVRAFIKKGISEDELIRSKNHLVGMHEIGLQTNSSLIFMTSLDELYGLGYGNYKDYKANVEAVAREDVKKVAGKYLALDRCAIVTLEGKGSKGEL